MSGSEIGEDARVSNQAAGHVTGHSVQAGEIHGDVHFHQATSAASSTVPRQLPSTVRHFVNRTVEQDALTTLLNGAKAGGVVLISAVDGAAGVGKSSLVVHWGHKVREQFPDGELYVNLRGFDPLSEPMSASEALRTFLTALDVPAERIPDDVDARAALLRSLLHNKQILVVLDNARSSDQVRPLLPGSQSCLVLVTSRNRLDDLVIREGASRISLDVLSPNEARRLLGQYLGQERLEAEPAAVTGLIEHCAGLPLALSIVAVRAAGNPDFPLDILVDELHDAQERLDALDAGGDTGVRSVFSWSYRSLSEPAARLFRLLGLPSGPDISLAAAADLAGLSQRECRKLMTELIRANLIYQHKPGRYQCHDLLRAYASECAANDETDENRAEALQRLYDHYLLSSRSIDRHLVGHSRPFAPEPPSSTVQGLPLDDEQDMLLWWDTERPNSLAAVRQANRLGWHLHAWQLSYNLMYLLKLRSQYTDWISTYEVALDSARRLGDRVAEAHLLYDLGTPHIFRKQYETAAGYLQQAGDLFEAIGDQHHSCAALTVLAEVYVELQRYDAALDLLQRGLELQRVLDDVYGQGQINTVLGYLYSRRQEPDKAHGHFSEALPLYQAVGEKYGEAFIHDQLGDLHHAAGQHDDAVHAYRQAINIRQEIGHKQGEAISLRGLGNALRDADDREGARSCLDKALAILEDLGDPQAEQVRVELDSLAV